MRAIPVLLMILALSGSSSEAAVRVVLELAQEFFYEGDPLALKISVRNETNATVPNPIKSPLYAGLKIANDKGELEGAEGEPVASPDRPEELGPNAFYGGLVDAADLYPGVREVGRYLVHWSDQGMLSNRLTVRVIPKFDPTKEYSGEIVTDRGSIQLSFFKDRSPIAVRSFIDMAHAGVYDGIPLDEVRRDEFVVAGRAGDPTRRPFLYPAEPSNLPLVAGTVIMKPAGAAPPTNGPEFIILLKPQPAWAGQVTVLGQVTKGLDLVQMLSRLPTAPDQQGGARPMADVQIKTIKIAEKKAPA